MTPAKTVSRNIGGLNINAVHKNRTINNVVFILGGILIVYSIYSLIKQNKILSLQQQHMMMEIDKMQKDGIKVPAK